MVKEPYELEEQEFSGECYRQTKIIRNGGNTGIINVPKRLVGKKFTMYLVPGGEE